MLTTYVLSFTLLSIAYGYTRDEYYANWMSIISDNSGASAFGGDITDLRIIDTVMSGSHHAGMYPAAIMGNGYQLSTDNYRTSVLDFTDTTNTDRLVKWAKRQRSTVLDQLEAGSRFLDIRLETKSGETYAHNGVLGATFDTILADIKSFLDASATSFGNEIIILSFSEFLSVDANAIFTTMQTQLSSYMQPIANYDLSADTISSLLTAGVNVIPFIDDATITTTNTYVHPASTRLTGTEPAAAMGTVAISEVISGLVTSWDTSAASGQLNLIYYVLNVATISEYTKYSNLYASFAEYSTADLMVTLSNTINTYPKLYFGNVIIVDFVEKSNVVDEAITLNYNYFECRDPVANWGDTMDCASLTDLSRDYKESDTSDACVATSALAITCLRSCGGCSWSDGVPGSSCAADADCDSGIYGGVGVTGSCFERDDDWDSFIKEATFCLAPYKGEDCGSKSTNVCSGDAAVEAGCTAYCSSDYQCLSGYCDTASGVCLGFEVLEPTTTAKSTECYCPYVISDEANSWRDYLAGYRPGDPDAEYAFVQGACSNPADCNAMLDANPYIKSLIGFIIIPFVLAIIMFVIYFFCCSAWCCCTKCCKKCCCKCCLGDTDEQPAARWIPTILMLGVFITILWGAIEGVTANGAMHDHIFADDSQSLRTEMLGLFDTVIDKFSGIKPEASWIVNNVKTILGSVGGIVSSVQSGTSGDINAIYGAFNNIAKNYDGFEIVTNVSTPFIPIVTETVVLPCEYCTGLGVQISDINNTFKSAISIIDGLQAMLNSTGALVSAEESIDEAMSQFNAMVDNFTSLIQTYRNSTENYLDDFEAYDIQREQALSAFFGLWILFFIFWIIGIIFGLVKCCPFIGECFFKCTWCNSMFFGAIVMLVFSFFAIISVGWADLCYNLDEFEADPEGSNLGLTIAGFTGNGSSGSMNPVTIVNACWAGSDVLEALNLTDQLDWSSLRENMTDVLDMDITKELTLDALDSFVSEINLLSTDEFEVEGDRALAVLNAVGGVCVCDCLAAHGTTNAQFTRAKMLAGDCHNSSASAPRDCWQSTYNPLDPGFAVAVQQNVHCITNFTAVYVFLQAEVALIGETTQTIADIKNQTSIILQAYDGIFGVAVDIENTVKNISCSIDPIFEKMDALIANYSTCGFIGEAYGGFKQVGCVLLFGDMYGISKGMMVIAFTSFAAVFFGMMSEYSWYPVKDTDEDEDDVGAKLMKSVSSRFGPKMGLEDNEEQMSNEMELATKAEDANNDDAPGDEMAEGDGAPGGEGGESQPAAPEGPPPEPHDTARVKSASVSVSVSIEAEVVDDGGIMNTDDGPVDDAPEEEAAPSAPTDFEADTTQESDVL